jgi:signal transduction histidine kinase
MPPPLWSLRLVGDPKSLRAEAARTAAMRIPLGAHIRESSNIAAALATPNDEREVLVLLDPAPGDFKTACAALDGRALPRWAVVEPILDNFEDTALSTAQWEPLVVARSIGFAISLHTLRRDHARLSGDLHTVARRLTHDLRTPLNSISTANQALAGLGIAAEPVPMLHRAISEAVDDTGNLIERVATVLLAGVRPIVAQAIDMEEIVWNARERVDAPLRSAGGTITAPESWPPATGVASWLEFVWRNLLTNSVEHGGPTPRIELGWKRSGTHTTFWVRDSGPGVAFTKRAHLFHPFDRLNDLNAPRGYGLSLVQRLIELQGGTTGYTPEPAPGGTFYFTLPEKV